MDEKRLKYWLALSMLGVERFHAGSILERFGGLEEIFNASREALEGFSPQFAKMVLGFKGWDRAEEEIELAAKKGARIVTYEDPLYPPALKLTYDPPCLLYMMGNDYIDSSPAVAVVGTRHPSQYGTTMAETLGRETLPTRA